MNSRPRPYWRDCLVVSLAVGVIGVTFGVFADAAGFDLAQIVVMSALVFTGASQFAAVGVIDDGGSGGAAVGSALLLAARNSLYGPVARRALPASALIVVMTFEEAGELAFDSRVAGVAVGAVAAWRKAPLLVVVAVAMAVTAGLRAVA